MNIAKVYDANVYVNNASKHGLASEITAPTHYGPYDRLQGYGHDWFGRVFQRVR